MTIRKSVLAALGTATLVGIWMPQASQAAVTVTVPRPVINIPKVAIPAVKPVIPAVRPMISAIKPTVTHPALAPKPVTPSVHPAAASTHAAVATHATGSPATHASAPGVATTLDPNIPVPAHTGPAIAIVLNGKPVIKLTNVNGNETTVYYLSSDQKHIVSVISSISTGPSQSTAPTQPSNQPAPQQTASTQPAPAPQPPAPAPQQPAPSKPPASSGHKTTYTPVSYPEIKGANGGAIGYINDKGQPIYFNNGQLPPGFFVGPNNTIQTNIKSTS